MNPFDLKAIRHCPGHQDDTKRGDYMLNKHSSLPVPPRPLPSPSRALISRIPRLIAPPVSRSSLRRPASVASRTGESVRLPASPRQYRGRTFSKIYPPVSFSPQKKKLSQAYPSSQCLPSVESCDAVRAVDHEDDHQIALDRPEDGSAAGDPLGRAALLREMSETLRCGEETSQLH